MSNIYIKSQNVNLKQISFFTEMKMICCLKSFVVAWFFLCMPKTTNFYTTLVNYLFFSVTQFVAQPNCQQLLASRWYNEFPGWRRRHWAVKLLTCIFIGLLFPLLCISYLISPKSRYGLFIRKPFIKFICHTASYLTFLFLLFLASQHIASPLPNLQGPPPTTVEWMILPWVIGNVQHTHAINKLQQVICMLETNI